MIKLLSLTRLYVYMLAYLFSFSFFTPFLSSRLVNRTFKILVRKGSRKENISPWRKALGENLLIFKLGIRMVIPVFYYTRMFCVDSIAIFCDANRKIRITRKRVKGGRASRALLCYLLLPITSDPAVSPKLSVRYSCLNDRALFPFHPHPQFQCGKTKGRGGGRERDKHGSTTESLVFAGDDDLQFYTIRSLQTQRANGMMKRETKHARAPGI